MGSLDLVLAVITTASAPRPWVKANTADLTSPARGLIPLCAPNERASSILVSSISTQKTRQPEAKQICAAICPTKPRPMITTVSPKVKFACRTPCIAIAPTVGFSVQVIKGTALASIIGFVDLTKAGTMLNNATFRPFLGYSLVALIYFCLCFPLSWYAHRLERQLNVAR